MPKQKQCLAVDTRTINNLGPGKFRTLTHNNTKQVCYYNRNKSDTNFYSFLSTRKQISQKGEITNLNNSDVTYIDLSNKLKNIDNDNFQSKIQQVGSSNTVTATQQQHYR